MPQSLAAGNHLKRASPLLGPTTLYIGGPAQHDVNFWVFWFCAHSFLISKGGGQNQIFGDVLSPSPNGDSGPGCCGGHSVTFRDIL